MKSIDIDGVRYIKASEAALLVGYTTDYVGQLTRAGKIGGERIGRTWYIKESDIVAHKKGNNRSNKEKTKEGVREVLAEQQHEIHHRLPDFIPEFRKRLLSEEVKYERDDHPLTPETKSENDTPRHIEILSREDESEVNITTEQKLEIEESPGPEVVEFKKIEPSMTGSLEIVALDQEVFETEKPKKLERPIIPQVQSQREVVVDHFKERLEKNGALTHGERSPIPVIVKASRISLGKTTMSLAVVLAIALSASFILFEKVVMYEQGITGIRASHVDARYDLAALGVLYTKLQK